MFGKRSGSVSPPVAVSRVASVSVVNEAPKPAVVQTAPVKIQLTNVRFRDASQLMNICQRIVSQVGRRVDESRRFATLACSTARALTSSRRRSRSTARR
jgi:Flp pilus assembly CpaF family ATPase